MSRSNIALTEGSGAKKTATEERTVGGVIVQSQYVLIDEPSLATFVICPGTGPSTAGANNHLLQLMAGSSAYVRINRITIEQQSSATTVTLGNFAIFRLSTAGTGGTAYTPQPYDMADTAGATAMTLPSSKGAEAGLLFRTALIMRQALSATQTQPEEIYSWEPTNRSKPIIIPAGTANGIVVKNLSAVAGATVIIQIEFTETAWL